MKQQASLVACLLAVNMLAPTAVANAGSPAFTNRLVVKFNSTVNDEQREDMPAERLKNHPPE